MECLVSYSEIKFSLIFFCCVQDWEVIKFYCFGTLSDLYFLLH